jgi:hypothetical protein
MANPENLLASILDKPDDPNTANRANDLLGEMFRGFPVENLKYLLLDTREIVVTTGIWMTTELGYRCVPLLDDALPLLWSKSKQIRFWALETLVWAPPDRDAEISRGLELLSDEESSVRWKATDFAIRATDAQLLSALQSFERRHIQSSFISGLRLLLDQSSNAFDATISSLKSSDPLTARFGLISAVRRRESRPELLQLAIDSHVSEEIKEVAGEWMRKR